MLGIKGSGMSSLAIILKQLGQEVSGSDYNYKSFTEEALIENNISIKDFDINNLNGIDCLVVGHSFIESNNIELMEAKKNNIKIIEYNDCLAQIANKYYSIAISGSNGKTTTTGLLSTILDSVENTSYLIGNSEASANKDSKYFIFEACEHKKHFLKYYPNLVLINNIDYDHVDFFKTEEEYVNNFYQFINHSKDKVVVNGDDKYLKNLDNTIVFGIHNKSMFYANNITYEKGIRYELYYKENKLGDVFLDYYGEHMVYNSLAALTISICLGIDIKVAIESIKKFKGVKRRFKEIIINDDVYIDDYAHHPSEIKATLSAVKQKYPKKKIIAFYRPDRVARLNYFSSGFAKELNHADKAFILPYINKTQEEIESIENFLKLNKNIKLVSENIYKRVAKYKDVVYIMMSSKDMSEVKESILKYKGD